MKLSIAAANAAADTVCAQLDGGTVRLYDGDIPATADTALGANTLLAELTFDSPAFGAAVDGVATAALTEEDDAPAAGVATFCLALTADLLPVFLGTVGLTGSGSDCELRGSTQIILHAGVTIATCTYRHPLV